LGPSPVRTTPTTRSTVSPSQTREFIGASLSAEIDEQLAVFATHGVDLGLLPWDCCS
jgi:hypothetical protein